ncbi:hypothetical protein AAFF_G00417640 [Aldrovandia affinis]|uniref:Interferon gamma n=1 Tax=Aldrovandia affinis TaxID=143900 RepID=A0AAD7SCH5_9TELE|nr:hypothetical protein AAFF_G00417640 [Aldrovandia affinis]
MNSLCGLLLFCGICFMTLGWANSVGQVPENIQKDFKKLKEQLHLVHNKENDDLFGNPLFLKKPDVFNSNLMEGEKKLLMQETLEVSLKILTNLMKHTPEEEMRTNILAVRGRVEDLRDRYYLDKDHILQKRLKALWDIKTDELETQRKAVYELMDVYNKANKLGSEIHEKKIRRRRRQAQRSSTKLL